MGGPPMVVHCVPQLRLSWSRCSVSKFMGRACGGCGASRCYLLFVLAG